MGELQGQVWPQIQEPNRGGLPKKIFLNNVLYIQQQNQRHAEGKSTFTVGINQFADLTTQEFKEMYNNYKPGKKNPANVKILPPSRNVAGVTIDWRTSNCVTPIKDQGQCGSCWSFSAIASTEFSNCVAGRGLTSLSEQNCVDCSYSYGNLGCNGGWMDSCFQYIIDNGGIDTEASYPYEATSGIGNCRFDPSNVGATLTGFTDILTGSEPQLTSALDGQAVSVAIDASHISFQLYTSGVYNEPLCTHNLDHGVFAVGYGNDPSAGDYYIVKNSWGTSWGEKGYINMSRNKNNQCGIADSASYSKA
jgi:cathepsin L